jgi:hypothetical protein
VPASLHAACVQQLVVALLPYLLAVLGLTQMGGPDVVGYAEHQCTGAQQQMLNWSRVSSITQPLPSHVSHACPLFHDV